VEILRRAPQGGLSLEPRSSSNHAYYVRGTSAIDEVGVHRLLLRPLELHELAGRCS
jgi:hypothetical protein